ncbi:MAG: hypothetical protein ACRENQ_02820 [Gemmatimonadaceae bacterium]
MSRVATGTPADDPWAGMARETADALRTTVSSVGGWLELLEERGQHDSALLVLAAHLRAELGRLGHLAQRVQRIAAEPDHEAVDLTAIVHRVAGEYRARTASLAHTFVIGVEPTVGSPHVAGDAVLLEWILDLLVQHSLDVLAGRGGRVTLSVVVERSGACRVRVADEGLTGAGEDDAPRPVTAAEGNGIALARRLAAVHRRVRVVPGSVDRGTAFDVIIE